MGLPFSLWRQELPVHAELGHQVFRKVESAGPEVLPHIPQDIGELHGVAQGEGPVQHPGVPDPKELREPPSHHRGHPVRVDPQLLHGPVPGGRDPSGLLRSNPPRIRRGRRPTHLSHDFVQEGDVGALP